jgi:hypothetical protein
MRRCGDKAAAYAEGGAGGHRTHATFWTINRRPLAHSKHAELRSRFTSNFNHFEEAY